MWEEVDLNAEGWKLGNAVTGKCTEEQKYSNNIVDRAGRIEVGSKSEEGEINVVHEEKETNNPFKDLNLFVCVLY